MTQQAVGAGYDPFDTDLADPYAFYALARRREPVFYAPALRAWALTRHQDVRYALTHPELFSSASSLRPLTELTPATVAELAKGYPPTPVPITADGAAHQRLRLPLIQTLTPRRIRELEPFIRDTAERLVDAFADHRRFELMAAFAYPLSVRVICHLLSIDLKDHAQVSAGSYAAARIVASKLHTAEQPQCAREYIRLQQLCAAYAHQRRSQPADDIISHVTARLAPGHDPLTPTQEGELAQVLSAVVIAGHVTASAGIGSGVRHLLADRDQWELLCAAPNRIPDAVEEILRFDPPVQGFLRRTTRSVTLGGTDLPQGAEVLLLYGAANHDPAMVDRPDAFDITRGRSPHLAFGPGPHYCVGAGLARAELSIALETLTQRLPGLRLVPDQTVDIEPTMTIRGPTALHLTW